MVRKSSIYNSIFNRTNHQIVKGQRLKDKRRQEIRTQCFPTDFHSSFTGDALGGALAAEKAADEAEGFAREAEAAADEVSAILQSMKAGKCCSIRNKDHVQTCCMLNTIEHLLEIERLK